MTDHAPPIVLASASPRRRELMRLLGFDFRVAAANVNEDVEGDDDPLALACRLSRRKALAVSEIVSGSIIVASDTIVVLEGRVLGKPADPPDAIRMLQALRGRSHHVISAITVIDPTQDAEITDWANTRVEMRDYTDEEIGEYVAGGDPLDKAGAYAIQHPGFHPVERIEGCYAGVMGFPLCHLYRALKRLGIAPARSPAGACQTFTGQPCDYYPSVLPPGAAGR